ncbi:MAG: BTAD domain-containing putative transcriptional regulator [Anaerolineales bacterium]|jgi:DNA-binding SARP family transcriptional activator
MPVLQINLLGRFSLEADGVPVPEISAARFQGLIAYLSLKRSKPVTRRQLASLFWPDSRPSQARANLRKLIYDLRHMHPQMDDWLGTSGKTLQWGPGVTILLDVETFENSLENAGVEQLESALEVYRGELLPGCYDDWILLERQRLESLYTQAIEKLIQELESRREYGRAIAYAQRLINIAPMEESNYRQLMRLYALYGDRAGLVRTFNLCTSVLQRELDIQPSPLTRRLYQRLIQMDGGLNNLPVIPASMDVYREQWAQLQSAWRTALSGHPHWALLVGDAQEHLLPLLEELMDWAGRLGIPHTSVNCYPTDTDLAFALPEAILRAQPLPSLNKIWMVEIARLLPEILEHHPNLEPPGPLEQPWQIHRFHEALGRAFIAQAPYLLGVHNLHWSDPQSLRWLAFLQRFAPDHPHLIVASLSKTGLDENPLLASLLETLEAQGQLTRIQIQAEALTPEKAASGFYLEPGLSRHAHYPLR